MSSEELGKTTKNFSELRSKNQINAYKFKRFRNWEIEGIETDVFDVVKLSGKASKIPSLIIFVVELSIINPN